MRTIRVFAALLATATLTVPVGMILAAAPATAVATDNTFTGACAATCVTTDWNTAGNWSLDHVPLATEDVKVNVNGKNPTLDSGTDGTAQSITIASGQSLTVAGGKNLTVGNGASSIDGQVNLNGGNASLGGATGLTGLISMNSATLTIGSGGTVTIAADAASIAGTGLVHVLSGGTLTRGVTGTQLNVNVPIQNDGQVSATNGVLEMRQGGGATPSGGAFTATSPGAVEFSGGFSLSTTARVTGTGTAMINGAVGIAAASSALPSPYDVATSEFENSGSILTLGLGSNGSTSTLNAISGSTAGAGTFTVTGTANINSFDFEGPTNLNGATTMVGPGVLAVGGTVNLNAPMSVQGGLIVVNGVFNVNNGASLDIAADGLDMFGAAAVNVLPGGLLKRSAAGSNGTLNLDVANAGTVSVDAGALTFIGGHTITQTAGLTDVKGNTLTVNAPFELQGGALKGTGTIAGDVDNSGGTVAPGASPGLLTINGNYTQGAGGTLAAEIQGTTPGTQFDELQASGNVSLDGTLAIANGAGFDPGPVDTFRILQSAASGLSGTFAVVTGAQLTGKNYIVNYDNDGSAPDGVFLTVSGATTRPTGTALSCVPQTVSVGDASTCTATVTDTGVGGGSTPGGTVSFSSNDSGAFSGAGSCTLSGGSCHLTYTPSAVGSGTHQITAGYGGDSTHATSNGQTNVTVSARSSATSVACAPGAVTVGAPTTCTATVSDPNAGGSTPGGTVSFSSNDSGAFSGAGSCTLSGGSCHLTYTPSAVGSGTHQITAGYGGDSTHATSNGQTNVTVSEQPAGGLTVICAPRTVVVGDKTRCRATLKPSARGPHTKPTGTVTFSSDGTGTFSSEGSCTVVGRSCHLTYTPTAVGSGTHLVTATYAGDSTHPPASGEANVTVTPGHTRTILSCSPRAVAVGEASTCDAFVIDRTGIPLTPSGTVTFSSDSSGNLSSSTCTLAGSGARTSCDVTYTPSAAGFAAQRITARYDGDSNHLTSAGHAAVFVAPAL